MSTFPLFATSLKPFLKWAGGKSQLLKDLRDAFPQELGNQLMKYAEPFIGGGAVLFDVLGFFELEEVYIGDANRELINTYQMIQTQIDSLIEELQKLKKEYLCNDEEGRKEYYYAKRNRFNELKCKNNNTVFSLVEMAALFIFINRTCFNGLYRVNRKGEYNVPMGGYKNPAIFEEDLLRQISKRLADVTIVCADYKEVLNFADEKTFVYFDPPYRPLTTSAAFTAYTEFLFDDSSQRELADVARKLDSRGTKWIVSNSDPKNIDPTDDFFENIYAGFNIQRVQAARMINSNGAGRGKISELLISNF